MEEKGQSWLASRNSATSLHSPVSVQQHDPRSDGLEEAAIETTKKKKKARSMPGSRYASRAQSRAGSRVDLRMTSQLALSSSIPTTAVRGVLLPQGLEGMEPDFVDLDEREEEEGEEGEEGEVVNEGEMRRLVMGRVGGWVDWMVGWMDWRGDGDEEEEGEEGNERGQGGKEGVEKGRRRGEGREEGVEGKGVCSPAPGAGGVWEDARWLMKVAAESL